MKSLLLPIFLCIVQVVFSQNLPEEYYLSADGKILFCGGKPTSGFYDQSTIKNLYLNFSQSNYWTLLTNNYASKKDLVASMTFEGVTYDSIGVRFKGQTSFGGGPGGGGTSTKKSFNISMDAFGKTAKLQGYKTLNLNNAFQDPSFMREVFYYQIIRGYTPAAKANWVRLFLNGQDWGLYPNVQQLNGDFLQEWYPSNNGSNWRADASTGGAGGGWGNRPTGAPAMGASPFQQQPGQGGGFLAGAMQTAMGVAGGVLLGNAIAGMFSSPAEAAETPAPAAAEPEAAPEEPAAEEGGGFFDSFFGGGSDEGGGEEW